MRVRDGATYVAAGETIGTIWDSRTERVIRIDAKVRKVDGGWECYNDVTYEVVFRAGCMLNGWFSEPEIDEECHVKFGNRYDADKLKQTRTETGAYDTGW